MPRSGGLLENYSGPINDSLPGSRVQSNTPTEDQGYGGKTLADELGDLGNDFDSGDDKYSSKEGETSLQREAREQVERAVALHDKFLKDHNIRNDFANEKETETSPPPVPVSMAQRRFSQPDTGRSNTSISQTDPTRSAPSPSHKTPPRPLSFSSKTTSVKHTQVSPRRVSSEQREFIVTPPPLSNGVFATISREYGWAWLWWIIIPLLLTAAALFAGGHDLYENRFVADAIERNAEKTNANVVIDIASAISDAAKVLLDEDGTLRRLEDSPFNQAVLSIASVRKEILEAQRGGRSYLIWLIDDFVAKNRELDHDWRSFLQRQIEATAEFAGDFDGYARNAGSQGSRTDWIKAAYNITFQDFSDIPQKAYREGELLMCELLGSLNKPSCSPDRRNLGRLYNELMHEVIPSNIRVPPEAFETYSTAIINIAKAIGDILKTWENASNKIEVAKSRYNHEYGIGNVDEVAQELESTAKTLTEAMQSPLVYRLAAPEFPAAVRRLAESKIWTLTLQ
ncbi:hypothetical protein OCU04_009426 [Sclerotinia nivalis]|uniref:Uncharacterized protein n=1 Tax=Sclerotinia nivalis TaxID=352851 RepID=A0A9X0AF05_9HELO|nr:hypothetical protein OCU04_009426 [Sclerotinia nivalis]